METTRKDMETTLSTIMDEDSNKTFLKTRCSLYNETILFSMSEEEKLASTFILCVIMFIGSVTNPIMVLCINRTWSSNSSMCRYLLHLAIGDMIRIFFCLPIHIFSHFQLDTLTSKKILPFEIRIFLDIFTEILQVLILLLISRDRYYAVAEPFKKNYEQKPKSVFLLGCSWSLAIFTASGASYFYRDYLMCGTNISLHVYLLLFLVLQTGILLGILQFYLRIIYFLWKRKKMQILSKNKVYPFTKQSDVKKETESTIKKILPKTIEEKEKENENELISNVIHPRVVDVAVADFKYPETESTQNERQATTKVDSDISKGLSESANILPTSLILVPSDLSKDVNERETDWKPQKDKPETIVTDLKHQEKEHSEMDINVDTTECLKDFKEGDRAQKLDIVINCMVSAIATKTGIVDSQNTSIINPKEEQSSFCLANDIGKTKIKSQTNFKAGVIDESTINEITMEISKSSSDQDSKQNTVGTEKLFVISRQVKFTTFSDINRPSSCSAFEPSKTESGLQQEKAFVIPANDIKSDDLPNIGNEASAQTKVYEQIENKTAKLTEKEEIRKRNSSVEFSGNNSSPTTNRVTLMENEFGQTFQVTTTDIVGPFCPLPRKSKSMYRKEVQVTQRITILIIILLICWVPLYVTRFVHINALFKKQCCIYREYRALWWEFLSLSSSAFDPCLYGILNNQLRNEFYRLMRRFRDLLRCK